MADLAMSGEKINVGSPVDKTVRSTSGRLLLETVLEARLAPVLPL